MTSNEVCLGDFYPVRGGSVDPSKYSDETFELFSIPAYDRGEADKLPGSEIGSSKKLFQPNDILLSRIVPHIRRCWIVTKGKGLRQIGSGEWIVFRALSLYPRYLRYYLLSDFFNLKFMSTVKGIGGSLLRADPKQVAKFKILIPSLDEQKQIVAILDAADELRQKDKALIAKYDELTQSLFLDMFGDPVANPKGWENKTINELTNKVTDGTHHTPRYVSEGVPFLRVTDLTGSNDSKKFISKEEHSDLIKRCNPEKGDILYSKNGTIGVGKIVNWDYEFSIFVSLCLLKPKHEIINVEYLNHFLNTPFALRQAMKHSKLATITNLHLIEIKKMNVPFPPLERQNEFAKRAQEISSQKAVAEESLNKSEDLFNSLLQNAIKGELKN
jgi:type I restriction enzyme, S subunit